MKTQKLTYNITVDDNNYTVPSNFVMFTQTFDEFISETRRLNLNISDEYCAINYDKLNAFHFKGNTMFIHKSIYILDIEYDDLCNKPGKLIDLTRKIVSNNGCILVTNNNKTESKRVKLLLAMKIPIIIIQSKGIHPLRNNFIREALKANKVLLLSKYIYTKRLSNKMLTSNRFAMLRLCDYIISNFDTISNYQLLRQEFRSLISP